MIRANLVIKSILNRWLSCFLIILTLSSSISLFFIVTRIQDSVKTSFQNTVSGVDTVVSARGGDIQILLNTVLEFCTFIYLLTYLYNNMLLVTNNFNILFLA